MNAIDTNSQAFKKYVKAIKAYNAKKASGVRTSLRAITVSRRECLDSFVPANRAPTQDELVNLHDLAKMAASEK
jgi:hypothetical protein